MVNPVGDLSGNRVSTRPTHQRLSSRSLQMLVVLGISTVAGAATGAAVGFFLGGVGAVPGAVVGGQIGLDIGTLILT